MYLENKQETMPMIIASLRYEELAYGLKTKWRAMCLGNETCGDECVMEGYGVLWEPSKAVNTGLAYNIYSKQLAGTDTKPKAGADGCRHW